MLVGHGTLRTKHSERHPVPGFPKPTWFQRWSRRCTRYVRAKDGCIETKESHARKSSSTPATVRWSQIYSQLLRDDHGIFVA